ncbi:hypothetical protein [Bacteroides congonensis]
MKKEKLKRRLCFLGVLSLLSFLICSCLSDEVCSDDSISEDEELSDRNSELTISEAKQWYNANNPPVTKMLISNFKKEILIKPQWDKAKERKKREFEIVEVPLQANKIVIFVDSLTLQNSLKIASKKIRNIARLIVRKNLKTGEVYNFVMIIRGSYEYLMKTNRLGKNNYFHREPDFSGDIYFYEVGQSLMSGYRYKSGEVISRISLGIPEENIQVAAQMPGACHNVGEPILVGEKCTDYVYGDAELGESFPVCEQIYEYQYHIVCDYGKEPVPGEPIVPPLPGNKEPPKYHPLRSAACDKADKMTDSVPFLTQVSDLYIVAECVPEEKFSHRLSTGWDGSEWLAWKDLRCTHYIKPTLYDGNGKRRLFREEDQNGKVFDEWYHLQPNPGIGIPLLEDLKELGVFYRKGRVNVSNFTYGIISMYGCLSLMITFETGDFNLFAMNLEKGRLDAKYNQCIQEGIGKSEKQRIGLFIKFLDDNYSGLTVIYAYSAEYTVKAFYPQIIDENNNMMDNPCK